jgi:Putative MetA-pathway of phenol degradation
VKKRTLFALRCALGAAFVAAWAALTFAEAEPEDAPQSPGDAWWTGPLLAYSAHSLPQGHMLIEPYLYDVAASRTDSVHSFTYFLYGATDRLTVGMAPDIAFTSARGAPDSSGVHLGDTNLRAQYMLTAMDTDQDIPDLAVAVLQTVPTGKYDRLNRASDGFGAGAYATSLAVYSQMVWWMPNGRLLRTRLDLSEAFAPRVPVADASVYGTDAGFLGHAQPGNQFSADAAFEYSLTRNWVLALDLIYNHGNATFTRGIAAAKSIQLHSGSSDAFGFAPALEYNWTSNLGVLAGLRVFPDSHNTKASVTPAIAINYVL